MVEHCDFKINYGYYISFIYNDKNLEEVYAQVNRF